MDMTPALPALSPSRLASTRSDVVERKKKASRGQAKFFLLSEFVRLPPRAADDELAPSRNKRAAWAFGDAMETERLVSCPKAALTT
jgi:hypothetical protein